MKTTSSDLLAALEEAKDELIELYERLYPDDESDNETTRVIDRVIKTIEKARRQ
jgi:DNA-binding ferritin-like protein